MLARQGRRRPAAGVWRAAAGGSVAEGRGAGAAHSPGRGGLRLRPERRQASSPICWPCPLPSAARGRRLRGVASAARVRGGGSARAAECGCRAPGRRDFASSPTGGGRAALRPRGRPLRGGQRAEARGPSPELPEPERAAALLVCRRRAPPGLRLGGTRGSPEWLD